MSRRPLGIRLWMIGLFVALVAVSLGVHSMHRRSARFRELSIEHSAKVRDSIASAKVAESEARRRDDQVASMRRAERRAGNDKGARGRLMALYDVAEAIAAQSRAQAARFRRRAEHHAELDRKYDRAARYPWVSVNPDPADPN